MEPGRDGERLARVPPRGGDVEAAIDRRPDPAELVRACPLFPETFDNLYASGEISGKLDETLRRLYTYYQEEGTLKLQAFATWTPRLIYLVIVLCIAYFIIQFYTGYFMPAAVNLTNPIPLCGIELPPFNLAA